MEDFILTLEDLLTKLGLDQTKNALVKEKQDLYNTDLNMLDGFYGKFKRSIIKNDELKDQQILRRVDSGLLFQ